MKAKKAKKPQNPKKAKTLQMPKNSDFEKKRKNPRK